MRKSAKLIQLEMIARILELRRGRVAQFHKIRHENVFRTWVAMWRFDCRMKFPLSMGDVFVDQYNFCVFPFMSCDIRHMISRSVRAPSRKWIAIEMNIGREYEKKENDYRDERENRRKRRKNERKSASYAIIVMCRYVFLLWCNSQRPYLLRAELDEVGDRYKKMRLVHVEAAARVSAWYAKTSGDGSSSNTDGG